MAKIFMPEASAEERLKVLRDHAEKVEETTYEKELTLDELDGKREEFVDNAIQISKWEDELNDWKKQYKAKIDPLKVDNRTLQQEVKSKKTQVKGVLFHMADHEHRMMETYDEFGELVSSRRLRPDEKQARLFVHPKAVGE